MMAGIHGCIAPAEDLPISSAVEPGNTECTSVLHSLEPLQFPRNISKAVRHLFKGTFLTPPQIVQQGPVTTRV